VVEEVRTHVDLKRIDELRKWLLALVPSELSSSKVWVNTSVVERNSVINVDTSQLRRQVFLLNWCRCWVSAVLMRDDYSSFSLTVHGLEHLLILEEKSVVVWSIRLIHFTTAHVLLSHLWIILNHLRPPTVHTRSNRALSVIVPSLAKASRSAVNRNMIPFRDVWLLYLIPSHQHYWLWDVIISILKELHLTIHAIASLISALDLPCN